MLSLTAVCSLMWEATPCKQTHNITCWTVFATWFSHLLNERPFNCHFLCIIELFTKTPQTKHNDHNQAVMAFLGRACSENTPIIFKHMLSSGNTPLGMSYLVLFSSRMIHVWSTKTFFQNNQQIYLHVSKQDMPSPTTKCTWQLLNNMFARHASNHIR